jgi:AraC family transcriptional regulator, regulatory protein of adaptative response / DNA-3-methyladenine glycosylase II
VQDATYTWAMTTYSAVVTTGIYCRPGCSARPLAKNVRTFELPAAAEAAGFRACKRCRPYRVAAPIGSDPPELVCQAWQMIIGGALDDGGTEALLADRVGMSPRHLRRLFLKHLGATPDQLARSRRAHFARRLLDDTDLTVLDVAFASGFGSLRQFNRTMREVFRASPTDLRSRRRRADRLAADGGLVLRLPVPAGYDWDAVRAFLAARAVPAVEAVDGDTYRRTITVGGAPGLLEISPGGDGHLLLRAHLPYWEGLIHVVGRVGRLLGTDTDHAAGVAALCADVVLGSIVRDRPGLAVPGAWDPFEVGVRAILSRGRGPGATARWLEALVTSLGTPVPGLPRSLTHTFPGAEMVTPASLAAAGLAAADATAVAALAAALSGLGNPPGYGTDALAALPGVDRDVRDYLAFRLGQREVFPLADASIRAALADLGLHLPGTSPRLAPWWRWRPWLALAAVHLMAHGDNLVRQAETRVTPAHMGWTSALLAAGHPGVTEEGCVSLRPLLEGAGRAAGDVAHGGGDG